VIKIRKKSRLKKRAILILAIGPLLSIAVLTAWRFVGVKEVHLFDSIFRIRAVHVEGVSAGRAADVRAVIKKQPAASLPELDTLKIQEMLVRLPWIKEVRLRKEWPDALVVRVVERTPFAWVEDRMPAGSAKGRYRLVDDDGVQMDSLDQAAAGFPIIRLSAAPRVPDPGRTRLKAGIKTLKAFEASGVELEALEEAQVEVRDAQDVLLRYKGLSLRLGFGDPNEQIRRFLILKPELLARAPEISEVDLRFPGRLIVRSKIEDKKGSYRTAIQTGLAAETGRVAQAKGQAAPRVYTERR
jgi:cell division septal protein FtsQ